MGGDDELAGAALRRKRLRKRGLAPCGAGPGQNQRRNREGWRRNAPAAQSACVSQRGHDYFFLTGGAAAGFESVFGADVVDVPPGEADPPLAALEPELEVVEDSFFAASLYLSLR